MLSLSTAAMCLLAALSISSAHSHNAVLAFSPQPSVPTPSCGCLNQVPSLRLSRAHKTTSTQNNLFGWGQDKKKEEAAPAAPQRAAGSGPCPKCADAKAINCPVCKGTGKDKKTGNVLERWKCVECQGFGFVSCPVCSGGKGSGLTPEQTGER